MLNKSNVERSNPSGEGQAMRSAGAMPNSVADQRTNAATARCESTTPFGRPVEPEVNRITAASPGPGVRGVERDGWAARKRSAGNQRSADVRDRRDRGVVQDDIGGV